MLYGKLKPIYNVVEGFENLPEAVSGLYQDRRPGKLQVRFQVSYESSRPTPTISSQ